MSSNKFLKLHNATGAFVNKPFTVSNRKKLLGILSTHSKDIAVPTLPGKVPPKLSIPALRDLYKGLDKQYSKAFIQDALLAYMDGDFPISNKPVASLQLVEKAIKEFHERCVNMSKGNKIMCIGPNVGRGKKYKQVL